jgi:hypothetical protein
MRETRTYGEIDNTGKLKIFRRSEFLQSLRVLFGDSKAKSLRVEVIVKKLYKKRSVEQNAYYRGVICNDFIAGWKNRTGDDISNDEAHELLKQQCNYVELINESTGEVIKKGKTTTNLSTVEMEEYHDKCRNFIFEWFGIIVLLPNEQSEIMFTEE